MILVVDDKKSKSDILDNQILLTSIFDLNHALADRDKYNINSADPIEKIIISEELYLRINSLKLYGIDFPYLHDLTEKYNVEFIP